MMTTAPVTATYRVQLSREFGFADVRRILPYLERLGVSHVYLSPLCRARSGSTHGYDVIDPATINPELGTDEEFRALAADARARNMGLVVDIVPNHMAAVSENPYWHDVLTHGVASRYAKWFDIDWDARGQRVVIPILGDRLSHAISSGQLRLQFEHDRLTASYHEHRFPIDPRTIPLIFDLTDPLEEGPTADLHELDGVLMRLRMLPTRSAAARSTTDRGAEAGPPVDQLSDLIHRSTIVRERLEHALSSFAARVHRGSVRLRTLLARQAYRLGYWRRQAREINYRRFFTVSHLVGVRQEDSGVFDATHEWIGHAAKADLIHGVRVDHVDGLSDPDGYLERLAAVMGTRPVWVEKILAPGESIPPSWKTAGTSGYEFLNQAEDLFIDPEGYAALDGKYRRFTGRRISFRETVRRSKRRILTGHLAADVNRLAKQLRGLIRDANGDDDISVADCAAGITETIVHFDRYRTYANATTGAMDKAEAEPVAEALAGARRSARAPSSALDALAGVLLDSDGRWAGVSARVQWIKRFEQLCVPAAAKGVEDTAFYVHVPLLSRCEVGGEPDANLRAAMDRFHAANSVRAESRAQTLLCTSTHDTKRSADVRARLDVLSERPRPWMDAVRRWSRLHETRRRRVKSRRAPDPNTMYHLYQALVGIWPAHPQGAIPEAAERREIADRLAAYAVKACREAKMHTSWIDPNPEFEDATEGFVRGMFDASATTRFLPDVASFASRVARWGTWNALARTVLHLTAPGIPDIYQGDELWSLHLVDPDNRRPVDFDKRKAMLHEMCEDVSNHDRGEFVRELLKHPEDGRLKLYVTHRILMERRGTRVFKEGTYRALPVSGRRAKHIIAFARDAPGETSITVVPRLIGNLTDGSSPTGPLVWGDTAVTLPSDLMNDTWGSVLTGARVPLRDEIRIGKLLAAFPAAVLTSRS